MGMVPFFLTTSRMSNGWAMKEFAEEDGMLNMTPKFYKGIQGTKDNGQRGGSLLVVAKEGI